MANEKQECVQKLAIKAFFSVGFTTAEVEFAKENGLDVEKHLLSREITEKAKRLGHYVPQPFYFGTFTIKYQLLNTYVQLAAELEQGFTGDVKGLFEKLPLIDIPFLIFYRHLRKLIELDWIAVSGNTFTLTANHDAIISKIITTGYRL